jgi:hypothetical protein
MFWGCGSPVSWRTVPGTPGSPPTLGKTHGPIYTTLQMKGLWEFNINVWFPCMYSQKWNYYFQNRIIMFCLPVPTLIYLWEIYISPGSVFLFCCREICAPILGIYKSLTDTLYRSCIALFYRKRLPQQNGDRRIRRKRNLHAFDCMWVKGGRSRPPLPLHAIRGGPVFHNCPPPPIVHSHRPKSVIFVKSG